MPFLPHPRLMTMLSEHRRLAVLSEVERLRSDRDANASTRRVASREGCPYCRRDHNGVDAGADGRRQGTAGAGDSR